MKKIFNFINPDEVVINRLNVYNLTSKVNYNYLISEFPHKSADLLFISTNDLFLINQFIEFQYIPYITYGSDIFLEKSFILGSSDFLKDPWLFNELEIRALRLLNNDTLFFNWGTISFSNIQIENDAQSLPLSVYEYKILSMLANNMDKVITRENMHYRLGILNSNSRVVDVYINSIRKKLSILNLDNNTLENVIKTVRGKGYTINSHYGCG